MSPKRTNEIVSVTLYDNDHVESLTKHINKHDNKGQDAIQAEEHFHKGNATFPNIIDLVKNQPSRWIESIIDTSSSDVRT